MKILAFAEQRDGKLKKNAFEVVAAAKNIASQTNGEVVALVIGGGGSGVAGIAAELGGYGAQRAVVVDDARLARYSTTAYAKIIAEVAKKEQANVVLLAATAMGKDAAPRVAVKLQAGLAVDCIA
ncbi:MAG TPA: electron transfer flavoprotein subunit alpha/FixB family protein, partial [Bacteroidota bacterium]